MDKTEWLTALIKGFSRKTFLIDQGKPYTFADLLVKIKYNFKQFERLNLDSGMVIAMRSNVSFNGIAMFLSLMLRRCIIVPIISDVQQEIDNRINASGAEMLIDLGNNDEVSYQRLSLQSTPKPGILIELVSSGNSGLILFSSGSTGKPKVMLHNLDNLIELYSDRHESNLKILLFLMFDHIGGLNTLFIALASGITIIIAKSSTPESVANAIAKHRVNVLPTTPTFLNLMLMHEVVAKYDLSSLKMISYGTESMPVALLQRLKGVFPRVRFIQTFGTSETGISNTVSKSSSSTSIKLNDPNVEYKIVDNELWLRSKKQIMGYLNLKYACITKDGWFKTGDLVEVLDDGYLNILGRNSDIINVGGEKVYPVEIESILFEMPEIDDCLVYGRNNPITGESVCVDIVPLYGQSPPVLRKKIRKFCNLRLHKYKIPTAFKFVDSIPYSNRLKRLRKKL